MSKNIIIFFSLLGIVYTIFFPNLLWTRLWEYNSKIIEVTRSASTILLAWFFSQYFFKSRIIDHQAQKDKELAEFKSSLSIFADKEKQEFQKDIVWFRIVREKKIEVYQEAYRLYMWARNLCDRASVMDPFSWRSLDQILEYFKRNTQAQENIIQAEKYYNEKNFLELNKMYNRFRFNKSHDKFILFQNYFLTHRFYFDESLAKIYTENYDNFKIIASELSSLVNEYWNANNENLTESSSFVKDSLEEIERMTWEFLSWLN